MDLYHVLLFLHILGAVVLIGSGLLAPAVGAAVRRAESTTGLLDWLRFMLKVSKAAGPAAGTVLLTGLYMTWAQWSFRDPWIVVSLVLFAIAGGIATGVLEPRLKQVIAAAESEPPGAISPELRAAATQPLFHTGESVLLGTDLAILFLMTNKPALVGSLAAVAAGWSFAGVLILRAARHRAAPAVAA